MKFAGKKRDRNNTKTKSETFEDKELPHELFLTTKQTTKINAFANNMSICQCKT